MARITPAHAGKTLLSLSALMRDADHPRACGENRYKCYEDKVPIGSPPRMRGKHSIDSAVLKLLRITPAHAGKTLLRRINALVKADHTPAHAGKTSPTTPRLCSRPDHPRACGENPSVRVSRFTTPGSPPRMRGKHEVLPSIRKHGRITPAHAGKTSRPAAALRSQTDHPRACGENGIGLPRAGLSIGSPPRMRGKRRQTIDNNSGARITPAHAGKTLPEVPTHRPGADHPRACGENSPVNNVRTTRGGSPPRMRGKQQVSITTVHSERITPAHAGKTLMLAFSDAARPDHPRACGENRTAFVPSEGCRGSPPRMRGKHSPVLRPVFPRGITPAHAGKTGARTLKRGRAADHPRACGENAIYLAPPAGLLGSPPRMRGKHAVQAWTLDQARITPAHAGKTTPRPRMPRRASDHPRACGENTRLDSLPGLSPGSPPRMRGKHPDTPGWQRALRITPAHAGKTGRGCAALQDMADHPRACGENKRSGRSDWRRSGSPPRMRGKRALYPAGLSAYRITPAHAGKTVFSFPPERSTTDHPRACGENDVAPRRRAHAIGSPPRMRGKRRHFCRIRVFCRITPAHAGKTLRKWRISVVDPSPQPQSSLTSRKADASSGSQRAPCAAPV